MGSRRRSRGKEGNLAYGGFWIVNSQLTARGLPQTILLAALFLLIVVATTLLACGPAAQTVPADDVALPAAPVGGGDETLAEAEEPTKEPTAEPGDTDTPTPETGVFADTPTPEPGNTDTPTPEGEEATATPAATVTPEPGEPIATATPEPANPVETITPEPAEPTATPTPQPTICLEGPRGTLCVHIPPRPTPKYPALGNLSRYVQEAEAATESGQSRDSTTKLFVMVSLAASPDTLIAWLQGNGVPLTKDIQDSWAEGIKNRVVAIYDFDYGYIYAVVPTSLLVSLSQQEGVIMMEDGCDTMMFWCYFQDES